MAKQRVLSFLTLGLAVHFAAIVAIPAVKDVTGSFNALGKSFPLLKDRGLLQGRDLLPTGTCNAETPCPIAACCGTNGLCGYSPAECGVGNCTSKCDSKAECGQYGTSGQQNCPLNVCCSQFGFCGSTDDFCTTGCQQGFGGCGPPKRPSCGGGTSANKRTIGYYESWSNTRKCQSVAPEDLNLNGFTHINFAFAFFDPSTFQIAPMDGSSGDLYNRFTALKDTNQGLQTWISVGGWSFTDPGPTRTAFSTMSSSSDNRAQFIDGLKAFMDTYGFDGVDIDWEYPQADDRGGAQGDTANYVSLVKEMRAVFGAKYGITVTLPTSYWYLQHFDLPGLQANIDWFNLMSYDLHGVWDAQSKFVGPYIAPHTNITEIDLGLDLLWRAGVDPGKVVLGQGWYGRSFTLKDPSCNTPNGVCQFSGGANPGPCSNAAGILDLQEIKDIVSKNNVNPTWDKTAGVKWITWDSNQWVSYDDDDTFTQKRDFANSRCLAGTMVWAMDQVDQTANNGLAPAPGVTTADQEDAKQKMNDLGAGISCYTTDCNVNCMKGTNQVAQMNGQPGQLSTNDRCPKGQYRNLCCADGTTMGKCEWRGYRGVGLSCISGCADGETEIVKDTNNHVKKKDQDCTGGLQSFCCKGFKPAPNVGDLAKEAADAAKEAAEAAAEQAALDIAAKAFCRVAVPALLAPLEALEDLIPIVGEILDIAEIAATPALIQACVKGVEKEGKAEFKVFGKKHTLSINEPTEKPTISRPPESSHTPAKTSSEDCSQSPKKRGLDARAPIRCRRAKHVRRTTSIEDAPGPIKNVNLDCVNNPQPCLHYNSIINHKSLIDYRNNECPYRKQDSRRQADLQAKADWEKQHPKNGWWDKIPPIAGAKDCEADEWPPAALYYSRDGYAQLQGSRPRNINKPQFIRLIDGNQNGRVGASWQCPAIALREDTDTSEHSAAGADGTMTSYTDVKCIYTRTTYRINLPGLVQPDNDDGLEVNSCYPRGNAGTDYRGFALLNDDPWYDTNPGAEVLTAGYLNSPPFKRGWVDPDLIVALEANSSRKVSDEELRDKFGLVKCESEGCEDELEEFAEEGAVVYGPPLEAPADAPVLATTLMPAPAVVASKDTPTPRKGVSPAEFPLQTQG